MPAKEYCKIYQGSPRQMIDAFITAWVASPESALGAVGKGGRPDLMQVAQGFPVYIARICGGKVIP